MTPYLCILLNGPAGSGKDTLARRLEAYGFAHRRFKTGLYVKTADYYGVSLPDFTQHARDRVLKEEIWPGMGLSPRQMLIHVSEEVIKPQFGKRFFGEVAAKVCREQKVPLVVFSDSGFEEEADPIEELFSHLVLVRLHRKEYSFEGDSRGYLANRGHTFDIYLEEDRPEVAIETVLGYIDPLLNQLGAG